MYQLIDAEIEPISSLTPTVVSDKTVRSIEFKLPEGVPSVSFDSNRRALYPPSEGTLTKEIRKDGRDALKVELVTRSMGTALKATWINRNHPDRERFRVSEIWGEVRLIEDLPPELRRAIEEIAYGATAPKGGLTERPPARLQSSQPQKKSAVEESLPVFSTHSFGSEHGSYQGYLFLPQFIIGTKTLKSVYLTRLDESSTSSSYVLHTANGDEIGPILESVDGMASDFVVGNPGIIVQLVTLGILDKTGFKSPLGPVGRARGELRKLTGVDVAAKDRWGSF